MNIEFLENLLNQISVSGSEENGQRVLREYMEQYADEIRTDEIGDVICVLNPEALSESCFLHMQMRLAL